MTLQIEFWQLVTGVASTIVAFALMVWAFGTILVKQFKTQLDHRFTSIQADLTQRAAEELEVAKQLRQFERDFAKFQIDMPLQYVRREDYIRGQTVIESKLDAVYSKLEVVQIQGAKQ
ncbi:MAG: hypothetical protein WC825_09325 [Gallionellaceae bacterium]|jgi:hypothetical protein